MNEYAIEARRLFDSHAKKQQTAAVQSNGFVFAQGGDVAQLRTLLSSMDAGPKRDESTREIRQRCENAHRKLIDSLDALAAKARVQEAAMRTSNVQRRAVMSDPTKLASAAAIRTLIAGASVNELLTLANDAVQSNDDAIAHALRGELNTRTITSESDPLLTVAATLNAMHRPQHEEAVAQLLGVQYVRTQAELGGPTLDADILDPLKLLRASDDAFSYESESGDRVTLRERDGMALMHKIGVRAEAPPPQVSAGAFVGN